MELVDTYYQNNIGKEYTLPIDIVFKYCFKTPQPWPLKGELPTYMTLHNGAIASIEYYLNSNVRNRNSHLDKRAGIKNQDIQQF
jgi:hypothetical protein